MRPLVIIGRGDHASVLADIARAIGREPAGFVDPTATGPVAAGAVSSLGDLEVQLDWLASFGGADFVVGIGDNRLRAAAFDLALRRGLTPIALIHPSVTSLGDAVIHAGAQVCASAVIGVGAVVEADAVVNTGATIDHHNFIGRHAFVAPGVHLAGRVTVGEGAHVGIGASIREGLSVGPWSVVGAGAAVVNNVPAGETWVGVPAGPIRARERNEHHAD